LKGCKKVRRLPQGLAPKPNQKEAENPNAILGLRPRSAASPRPLPPPILGLRPRTAPAARELLTTTAVPTYDATTATQRLGNAPVRCRAPEEHDTRCLSFRGPAPQRRRGRRRQWRQAKDATRSASPLAGQSFHSKDRGRPAGVSCRKTPSLQGTLALGEPRRRRVRAAGAIGHTTRTYSRRHRADATSLVYG